MERGLIFYALISLVMCISQEASSTLRINFSVYWAKANRFCHQRICGWANPTGWISNKRYRIKGPTIIVNVDEAVIFFKNFDGQCARKSFGPNSNGIVCSLVKAKANMDHFIAMQVVIAGGRKFKPVIVFPGMKMPTEQWTDVNSHLMSFFYITFICVRLLEWIRLSSIIERNIFSMNRRTCRKAMKRCF